MNLVTTQTNFNKNKLNKELKDFCGCIKLKAHFKNPQNKARFTEEDIFRKKKKIWIPNSNHQSTETFLEVTRNETSDEILKIKRFIIRIYL